LVSPWIKRRIQAGAVNCRGLRDDLLVRNTPVASRFELSGFPLKKYCCIPNARCGRNIAATSRFIGEIDWSAMLSRAVLEVPAEA
jgi:hypothetical protein